ncbi:hypothetical protein SAMN05421803_11776 [Nocardiopsis flavescens]|uniref:Uncharacterized protein n=2 Tax=Nocardiopsis flavescens TaxID=758803 RepID=A0A1M6REV5_9ACTN|nr:hypothetical protein SAMN05421803_11776 [Nocardiopsis flavescens]
MPQKIPNDLLFYFLLPFDLPIPSGVIYGPVSDKYSESLNHVSLRVTHTHVNFQDLAEDPYGYGFSTIIGTHDPGEEERSWQTWIQAKTTDEIFADEPASSNPSADERFSIIFERCMGAVNSLIGASQVATKENLMRKISKEGLAPQIIYRVFEGGTDALLCQSSFRLNNKKYNERFASYSHDDAESIRAVIDYERRGAVEGRHHPIRVARQLATEGHARLMSGDEISAIIMMQSAVEKYLSGVFEMILLDENPSRSDIDQIRGDTSFKSLFTKMLPDKLGGNWSTSNTSTPAGAYWVRLYGLRNQIIHSGHEPHWRDLPPASEAFHDLFAFVDEQVAKKSRLYPRALLAVTDPGAGGDGNLTKSQRERVQDLEGTLYWCPIKQE